MHDASPDPRPASSRSRRERGAVLVEFGFIAFLMYLLIAVTVDFGRLFYTAQAVQDAARATAREISVLPLPADWTLDQALQDPVVRQRVYQPEHLVVDLDNIPGGLPLRDFLDSLPVLNQTIRPLMIFDQVGSQRLLRFPGALLTDGSSPSGYTVGIPVVEGRAADGTEVIRWVPVIEEIKNPNFPGESPFALNTPAAMPQRGLVAIRINYPYQAAMLTGFQQSPAGPNAPNIAYRIQANDGGVTQINAPPGGLTAGSTVGPYAGPYGLGRMYAFAETVRPFRKLMSAQAIFRREVFE